MRIDLHTHSTASDGDDSPAELMRAAKSAGLDVIALTDHDTVGGHAEAIAALPAGLTLVPGAEISCRRDGVSLHLLAYLFDPSEPAFAKERELIRADRVRRAKAMVERCQQLGAPISWERVAAIAGMGTIGRPHVAAALAEAGVVPDIASAFTRQWLGHGGRAFVDKRELDPVQAIRLARAAGGVTVFAHPAASSRGPIVRDEVIAEMAANGLAGIEVDHPDHDPPSRGRLRGLAHELGLLVTGSSDYHGTRKTTRLGENTTDPEVYAALVAKAIGGRPVTERTAPTLPGARSALARGQDTP